MERNHMHDFKWVIPNDCEISSKVQRFKDRTASTHPTKSMNRMWMTLWNLSLFLFVFRSVSAIYFHVDVCWSHLWARVISVYECLRMCKKMSCHESNAWSTSVNEVKGKKTCEPMTFRVITVASVTSSFPERESCDFCPVSVYEFPIFFDYFQHSWW